VLGYLPEELLGRSATEFQHPEEDERRDARRRKVLSSRSASTVTYRSRRKDGSYVWLEASVRALYDEHSGALIGFQETARDISDRKEAEAIVARAREDAEQANNAKSEFLSRMSHELRTPLHAILGFGELLERGELRADQREKIVQITKGGRHLLELINEVLDLSRIERGELRLSVEPVHVGVLVQETLELIAPLAAARSVTLQAPVAGAAELHVLADRQRLKQVLLNLLSNAVKYNHVGGEVALAYSAVGSATVRFDVADSGAGIAAQGLARVFEPFERLGAEASEVEGTGLGLALSKRLVEAMEGEIGVESALGEGTRFWVQLVRADAPEVRAERPDDEEAPVPDRVRGPARTVLYVEDNPSNIKLAETILAERPEIRLIVATQGDLGLALAREHRPALVLLDLNLPDASGEDVLRQLRSDPAMSTVPIVIVSADATPGQVERLLAIGADDYLTKPFGIEEFLAVVDSAAVGEEPSPPPRVLDRAAIKALHGLASRRSVGPAMVGNIVSVFLDDAQRQVAALEEAIETDDLAAVSRQAHALRGASGGVGAAELASLCSQLEAGAKEAAVPAVRSVVARLGPALERARVALETEFTAPDAR
jgi:PAS domain S-box-containing protein